LRAVRDGEYIALQATMCFSTLRGEGHWEKRVGDAKSQGSPAQARGRLRTSLPFSSAFPACYVISDGGGLVVVRASGELIG